MCFDFVKWHFDLVLVTLYLDYKDSVWFNCCSLTSIYKSVMELLMCLICDALYVIEFAKIKVVVGSWLARSRANYREILQISRMIWNGFHQEDEIVFLYSYLYPWLLLIGLCILCCVMSFAAIVSFQVISMIVIHRENWWFCFEAILLVE